MQIFLRVCFNILSKGGYRNFKWPSIKRSMPDLQRYSETFIWSIIKMNEYNVIF